MSAAARVLDISRTTLYSKIKEFAISWPPISKGIKGILSAALCISLRRRPRHGQDLTLIATKCDQTLFLCAIILRSTIVRTGACVAELPVVAFDVVRAGDAGETAGDCVFMGPADKTAISADKYYCCAPTQQARLK